MLYAIGKEDSKIHFICPNKQNLDIMMGQAKADIKDYLILQEFDMKYVSRIAYIDGECVYNNKKYWTETAQENPLTLENYSEHEVLDFMLQPVTFDRYTDELNNTVNQLTSIDGISGQIKQNMDVGSEIISNLREECISLGHGNVTPESMLLKAANLGIIVALQVGCFREVIPLLDDMERDDFFTEERIHKYEEMIAAADAIDYGD